LILLVEAMSHTKQKKETYIIWNHCERVPPLDF